MFNLTNMQLSLAILFLLTLTFIWSSRRFRSAIFLLPAWFSPHKNLRVFFHNLRGVSIGKSVEIGYYVHLDNEMPNLIRIDDFATITNNCILTAHDHSKSYSRSGEDKSEGIVIGKHAFIGSASIILPGVRIGKKAIVGAGSVVTMDVDENTIVAGNPARKIKKKS